MTFASYYVLLWKFREAVSTFLYSFEKMLTKNANFRKTMLKIVFFLLMGYEIINSFGKIFEKFHNLLRYLELFWHTFERKVYYVLVYAL